MRTSQHGWMHAARARKAFGLSFAALVAAGVAAGSSPALRADWVELVNGQRYDNVKIVSAKFDAVQYKVGNAAGVSTQTGDKVLTIFRESLLLQRPRQLLEAGDGEKALRDLTPIISGNLKDDDWQKAEAAFLIGRAHRAAGDGKKAIESFKAYLEKNTPAKDWFVPSATHEMAQTLLDLKQPGTAELSFKELAKYGGPWTLRAKLGEAMALIASKGAAAALPARTLCDEIVRTREAPRELKNQALVLRAKILLLQENPQQAAKELTDGFFTPGKAEVEYSEERAEASLLLGRAYAALGGKENLEQAEIWYLKVPALYRKYTSVYAEACGELAALYEKAGNAQRASQWKSRAESSRSGPPQSASPQPAPAPAETPKESPKEAPKKGSGKAAKGGGAAGRA